MACNPYDFYVNGVFQDPYVLKSDIVDSLTSTDTDKPLSANQGKVVNDKIVILEDTVYEYEIFENIGAGTTGTVTIPTGATIRLDQYQGLADCLIAETENGRPIDQPARDVSEVIITATFDSSGNYVLSGTPSSYPISLIYQVAIKGSDIGNVSLDVIVDWTEISSASQVSYDNSTSGLTATNVKTAIDELSSEKANLIKTYVEKTANYTLLSTDYQVNCTANSFTISLPTAIGITGKIYSIKNSGIGNITIDGNLTELIDEELTQILIQYDNLTLMSTGSAWIII